MTASFPHFTENDRWCALGDSLTHGGRYHDYISLFYVTRYPRKKVSLFNCGINGDRTEDALRRLDGDVLSHNPGVVSVLFGMNDVDRSLYEPDKTGRDVEVRRFHTINLYWTRKMNAKGTSLGMTSAKARRNCIWRANRASRNTGLK